jgi:hypothetical protein
MIAAFAGSVMPALAQSDTGTRLGGRQAQVPDGGTNTDRARVWLERYAACIVRRDPKPVALMLDEKIESTSLTIKLTERYYDACLSGGGDADELRLSEKLLRGALYADRVTKLSSRIKNEIANSEPISFPQTSEIDGEASVRIALVRFGECVARADPVNAIEFVAAHAATELERKKIDALRPVLSGCITVGQRIKLSASILEAALAEAIYRMARSNTSPKVVGAGQ